MKTLETNPENLTSFVVTANLLKRVARMLTQDVRIAEPADAVSAARSNLIRFAKLRTVEATATNIPHLLDGPIRAALNVLNFTSPDPIGLRRGIAGIHEVAKASMDAYAAEMAVRKPASQSTGRKTNVGDPLPKGAKSSKGK